MKNIELFLNFDGNCEEAFRFYSNVFANDISIIYRYGDINDNGQFAESDTDRICYINLPITDDVSLLGSDTTNDTEYVPGRNISVCVNITDPEEAKNIYGKLSEGGVIIMPLEKTEWSDLYASFIDKFGINWMINLVMPNDKQKSKSIEPYLHFSGNSKDVIAFYSEIFNKEYSSLFLYKDLNDTIGIVDSDMNRICYASLQVSEPIALLVSDLPSSSENVLGNNVSIAINAETKEEADALYKKLSAEGEIIMPLDKSEWSEYYAWFIDKYGIYWMIDLVESYK